MINTQLNLFKSQINVIRDSEKADEIIDKFKTVMGDVLQLLEKLNGNGFLSDTDFDAMTKFINAMDSALQLK